MKFGPEFWALLALAIGGAVFYGLAFESRKPSLPRAIVKTICLAALTGAMYVAGAPTIFVIALAAAAIGDFLLAFEGAWALPLGMIAFLIMQVLYILTFLDLAPGSAALPWLRYALAAVILVVVLAYLVWFWREPRPGKNPILAVLAVASALALGAPALVLGLTGAISVTAPDSYRVHANLPILGVVYVAILLFLWLRRDLGLVKLGGFIYAATVLQMTYASLWLPWAAWPAMLGAVSFVVSDGVLSAELFRLPPDAKARRYTGPVVWWTYAGAQVLIVWGVIAASAT